MPQKFKNKIGCIANHIISVDFFSSGGKMKAERHVNMKKTPFAQVIYSKVNTIILKYF